MYTAKVVGKLEQNGQFIVDVEFTNGTETKVERIIPDSKDQFRSWVAGRLYSLNSMETLKTEVTVDQTLDPANETPTLPADEQAFIDWKLKVMKLQNIKVMLVDTGILTGDETQITNLKNDIKNTMQAGYVNKL